MSTSETPMLKKSFTALKLPRIICGDKLLSLSLFMACRIRSLRILSLYWIYYYQLLKCLLKCTENEHGSDEKLPVLMLFLIFLHWIERKTWRMALESFGWEVKPNGPGHLEHAQSRASSSLKIKLTMVPRQLLVMGKPMNKWMVNALMVGTYTPHALMHVGFLKLIVIKQFSRKTVHNYFWK